MEQTLYQRARALLQANPDWGKKKLAHALGVQAPLGRRLKERYRGETEGHRADPLYQRLLQLKAAHPEWGCQRVSQTLGVTVDMARLLMARYLGALSRQGGPTPPHPPSPESETPANGSELQDVVKDGTRDLSYRGERIQTLDDLLVFAQVDTSVWEVEKHVINKWEVGARGPGGEILSAPLFQIKVWFRRKVVERQLQDLLQGLLAQFRQAAPVRPAITPRATGEGLLEVSIMDLHLGKFAWEQESGRQYDPAIAEKMFWTALEDLLGKAAGLKPSKILFVAGNDFFNTDSLGPVGHHKTKRSAGSNRSSEDDSCWCAPWIGCVKWRQCKSCASTATMTPNDCTIWAKCSPRGFTKPPT